MPNLLVIVDLDYHETSEEYFDKLISMEFPWSLRLFGSIFVVHSEGDESDVASSIHRLAQMSQYNRLERTNQCQMEGVGEERRVPRYGTAVNNLIVCEIGKHNVYLRDKEKRKYLGKLMEGQ